MSNKIKLNLKELTVQSFTTSNKENTLGGGNKTQVTCYADKNGCWIEEVIIKG
jgi:hypothetical protein